MFQLDDNFLVSLGLGSMPAEEKDAFLEYVYAELEDRVGTELSKDLSDAQLEEFEKLVEQGDQSVVTQWLGEHCPNYKGVVKQEIENLRTEIIANKDRLLN
jgi:succinate dehydrogenase flavin-adding protein (antitoxin of CptAB toxin-antitoxin module)